jgi:hypothetical protein
MANTLKVLGQSNPAINTLSTLYTVPAATSTSVSSIFICNQNANTVKFRVTVNKSSGGSGDQPIYYDISLPGPDTFTATVGLSLATGDIVKVQTDTTNVTFSLFGVEVS